MTVLRTVGGARATKQWSWNEHQREWRKISYAAGAWFEPAQHPIANLAELVAILDRVRTDPRAFVVRGDLTETVLQAVQDAPRGQPHRIRRRKHEKGGVLPSLVEVARHWVMIDIDNWPLRAVDDLASDPEDAIDNAIHELLPESFHDAQTWWQLSSSAGFVPGYLKAHLWFWLAEPATNQHLKAVFEQHAPGIDRAPFSAAQPHFVADPIIEGGHDPLPRRCGWRRGIEQEVILPALVVRERPAARPVGTGATGRIGGIGDALAYLGHGEGGQGFHAPLRQATLRYALEVNRGRARDDDDVIDFLRHAIRSAPCRPGGDVERPYCELFYLQALIDGAFALLAGDPEIQTMRPHHQKGEHTLQQARDALVEHASGFYNRCLAWNALDEAGQAQALAEHVALAVGVGTGKSTIAREELPRYIARAKAAGQPYRVLWLVPTHKLAAETLEEMLGLGINAAIMRGREAADPSAKASDPDGADAKPMPMCLNLDAVSDAISIHARIEESVCGSARKGPRCPWRIGPDQCGFQRQKGPVAQADVVIMAHQGMFNELSKEVKAGLSLVVVDESWWQAGLAPHREVHLASFAQEPITYPVRDGNGRRSERNDLNTNDLHAWSALAQQAFEATAEGCFPSKTTVIGTGLTAANCKAAYALEWRRMYEGAIYPGQPAKERRKALTLAAGNAGIPRRAAIWRALQDLLEGEAEQIGRLQMGTRTTASGSLRVVVLHTRSEVRPEISRLPMLHLDATMALSVVQHYLPRLTLLAEINPITPHMDVHQVIGGWGKTSIVPSDKAAADENKRREGLVSELADFAVLNSGGNALVVTYQDIEPTFTARPEIRTGHFNAIAGLDVFKDVRSLFVIGRPLPDARELREQALALTGRAIPEESGKVETRGALMEDGTGAAMNVRTYTDPDMEALRSAITEAEIIQAVGRGRGVNRTADNPLSVFLFADVATTLPIARMSRWADIRPGVVARMQSRGLVLTSPADASRIYSDLFPTSKAAEHALSRAKADFPPKPLGIYINIGEWGGNRLTEVTYRPAGRGQQNRRAWVARDRIEGLAEWLTQQLGVAVTVEVVAPGIDPEPPPTPRPSPQPKPDLDEPPPGHPAWDQAPVEDWGGWEPAGYADVMVAPDVEVSEAVERLAASDEVSQSGTPLDQAEPLTCDMPALHVDAAAFRDENGSVILPRCPFCGGRHRHGGFGHRLAHCADSRGRGYVLRPMGAVPLAARNGWALGP